MRLYYKARFGGIASHDGFPFRWMLALPVRLARRVSELSKLPGKSEAPLRTRSPRAGLVLRGLC